MREDPGTMSDADRDFLVEWLNPSSYPRQLVAKYGETYEVLAHRYAELAKRYGARRIRDVAPGRKNIERRGRDMLSNLANALVSYCTEQQIDTSDLHRVMVAVLNDYVPSVRDRD